MSGQAKIEILLELKNRVKTGISKARENMNSRVKEMKDDISNLKNHHVEAFKTMRNEKLVSNEALNSSAEVKDKLKGNIESMKKDVSGLKDHQTKTFSDMRKDTPVSDKSVSLAGRVNNQLKSKYSAMKGMITKVKEHHKNAFASMRKEMPFTDRIVSYTARIRDKLKSKYDQMKSDSSKLMEHHKKAFEAMREEIPIFDKAMRLLGNPYVLVTAGVIGLSAALGGAMGKAADFNSEFVSIQNLNLDKSKKSLADYRKSILDTAMQAGTGAKATAKAFYDVQSATGKYGDDARQIVTSVAKYSIATGAKLEDSVNSTTKAMKAFGLGVQEIDSYLASNAKMVQVGIATFDELARVQTEYGGAAAGAGQDIDTANKLFAVFTTIAGNAATGATMTKSAFEGITQKQTLAGIQGMGVEIYKVDGSMRDLSGILKDVAAQFQTMSPKAIDETINKIGGPEGLRNMFVKLKTDSNDFFNTLETFDSSSFDLDKALKNALSDFNTLHRSVGERFVTLMSTLGNSIQPIAMSLLKGINNGLLWVYDNLGLIKDVLTSVTYGVGAAAAVWAVLNAGTIAFTASYYGLVIAQKTATVAQWALNVAMNANPIGIIITAIGVLVGAFVLAYKRSEKFRAIIDGLWASIKALGTYIKDGFLASFKSIWTTIKTFFSNIWNGIKNLIGGIADTFGGLGKIIKSALSFNWDGVTDGVTKLKDGLKRAGNGMLDAVPLTSVIKNYKELGETARNSFNAEYSKNAANRVNLIDAYGEGSLNSLLKSKGLLKEDGSRNMDLLKELKLISADGKIDRDKLKEYKKPKEEAKKDSKTNPLTTVEGEDKTSTESSSSAALSGMSSISGSSQQVRNITVSIDSFVKGGINLPHSDVKGLSMSDIEELLNEMFLRQVRSIETSMG